MIDTFLDNVYYLIELVLVLLYFVIIFFVKSRTNSFMISFVCGLLIIVFFSNLINDQKILKELILSIILFQLVILFLVYYMEDKGKIVNQEKEDYSLKISKIIIALFFCCVSAVTVIQGFRQFERYNNLYRDSNIIGNLSPTVTPVLSENEKEIGNISDDDLSSEEAEMTTVDLTQKEVVITKKLSQIQSNIFLRRITDVILLYTGCIIILMFFTDYKKIRKNKKHRTIEKRGMFESFLRATGEDSDKNSAYMNYLNEVDRE